MGEFILKKAAFLKIIGGTLGGLALLVAFNNCGQGFVMQNLSSSLGSGSGSGGGSLFSRAPGETCENALMKVYQSSFHPFLNQNCNSCHVNGPGLGSFASQDLATSYTSFSSIGADKISAMAVNDGHKPPYTGQKNVARVDELKAVWGPAQTEYAACVAEQQQQNGGGGPAPGSLVVRTTSKPVAANLATTYVRMEWDLETDSNGKVPLVAGIDIRRSVIGGVTYGYEFRNPTLRLKNTTSGNYAARALNLYINQELQSQTTTYSNIDTIINSTTNINLSPGSAAALAARTPATTDVIGLEFSSLGSTTGVPNPGGAPTPTPTPASTPAPVPALTYTQLVAAGGVFANNCVNCHRAGNALGGLDLTSYNAAKLAADNIRFRVNNANNPMPTGGLLPQSQRDIINSWVDRGAPQ